MRTSILLPLSLALVATTAAAALVISSSSFLGAPAGAALPFTYVNLPSVDVSAPTGPVHTPHAIAIKSPWTPTLEQLLTGDTVITSDAQMRDVWKRLFSEPYDAGQFDFDTEFVVLMGSEPMSSGSFAISDVEEVNADYANDGGLAENPIAEHFLSVTSTLFRPGVAQQDPPPPTHRMSAVRIARDQLDDVVFHRRVIMGI